MRKETKIVKLESKALVKAT